MRDWLGIIGFIVGTVITLAVIYGRPRIRRVWEKIKVRRQLAQVKRQQKRIAGKDLTQVDIHEPENSAALLIDVNNPPTWRIYMPKSGKPAPGCSCHGIQVQPGQKIMLWPIPGHPDGGMDIYCERTFQEAVGD